MHKADGDEQEAERERSFMADLEEKKSELVTEQQSGILCKR